MSLFNRKKNRKEKKSITLEEPINFTRVISIFFMVFFIWMVGSIFVLLSIERVYTFQDFVIIIFPLPCFLFVLIYLINKDDQIRFNNELVQKELDRVKELHDARKRAEKEFDNNG
jgi:Ca2+/Na+ antiporter